MDNQDQSIIPGPPRRWLVTGAAGFIGSHLARRLLALGQQVVGLDDLSSGHEANLPEAQEGFSFLRGDIRDEKIVRAACAGAEIVLHHAAIGSVVRSFEAPALVNDVNVGGTLALFDAARRAGARRFIYASSSAVYGDAGSAPCREDQKLFPKSPYAVGKLACEDYLRILSGEGGLRALSLRYFNIFGPRQDPHGPYAAVIPKWIAAALEGGAVEINGDGRTVRDFCHVDDVVAANIGAALLPEITGAPVLNIASGKPTDLSTLYDLIFKAAGRPAPLPLYKPFREGDIRVSCADITNARNVLGFAPRMGLAEGLAAMPDFSQGRAA